MKRSVRFRTLACGLLLASSGQVLAGPRAVEIERRGGPDQKPGGCWRQAARLALPAIPKGSDLLQGEAAVEPQRRVAMVPRVLSSADGTVQLRYWMLDLRSVFFLLP